MQIVIIIIIIFFVSDLLVFCYLFNFPPLSVPLCTIGSLKIVVDLMIDFTFNFDSQIGVLDMIRIVFQRPLLSKSMF